MTEQIITITERANKEVEIHTNTVRYSKEELHLTDVCILALNHYREKIKYEISKLEK